jgi:glucokinase
LDFQSAFPLNSAGHQPLAGVRGSVVAVDLGGTKLASAIVDASGSIHRRKKVAVIRGSVRALIDQLAETLRDSTDAAPPQKPVRAVGLIVPGIYFASTGNVWLPNLWGHEQVALRTELERLLTLPLVIDSDRAGYVLGEQWLGVARGVNSVVFLSIGTGIGAGIMMDGRLLRGSGDIAGAAGWFALTRQHLPIYRQLGCFVAEAAGPALARRANSRSAEAVVAAARAGDVGARSAIDETAHYLGMGIANIVSLLNPEMVVLGGGLMQAADLFLPTIKHVVQEWAQPIAAVQVRIEATTLRGDAGLFGAARLALAKIAV